MSVLKETSVRLNLFVFGSFEPFTCLDDADLVNSERPGTGYIGWRQGMVSTGCLQPSRVHKENLTTFRSPSICALHAKCRWGVMWKGQGSVSGIASLEVVL